MFNPKFAFAALALSAAFASAANNSMPSWSAPTVPTIVKMGPTYTKSSTGVISEDATPMMIIDLGPGVRFCARYSGDKNKAFYELAKEAQLNGKKVAIYSDPDATLQHKSCGDYKSDSPTCVYINSTNVYPLIQELAIVE